MKNRRVQWISSYGGRFITLPDASLSDWSGFPDGGGDPLDVSHDYGRACATSGYAELLTVGDTCGLVFGENEFGGIWLESPYPILFEWVHAASEDAVVESLARIPADLDAEATLRFDVLSDHLNVFDSVFPGNELELQNRYRFAIQSGTYTIASSVYSPNDEIGLIVHRFLPI